MTSPIMKNLKSGGDPLSRIGSAVVRARVAHAARKDNDFLSILVVIFLEGGERHHSNTLRSNSSY